MTTIRFIAPATVPDRGMKWERMFRSAPERQATRASKRLESFISRLAEKRKMVEPQELEIVETIADAGIDDLAHSLGYIH